MNAATPARLYATLGGAALIVLGVAGFFYNASFSTGADVEADELLGLFAVNGWQNLLHIATGLLGLASAGHGARAYALGVGLAYTLLAIWGFIEVEEGFGAILDLLPVNNGTCVLHLLLGLAGLGMGAATPAPQSRPRPSAESR
ncbi:MAG TPA: DUF4383 domain-containing protein [Solirubrobacterales bacterium]